MSDDAWFAAVASGDALAVGELLGQDSARAVARNAAGVSSLLWALYHRHPALAESLAAASPTLDIFELAALGRTEALREALAADPGSLSAWSADGFQALHLAAFFARAEAVDLLLAAGAEVNQPARRSGRMCALHSAAAARSATIVTRLLAAGANPNVQQEGGFTPLMAAAMHGDRVMVEALLAAGADPALLAEDGRDAQGMAEAAGHADVAALLAPATTTSAEESQASES